MRVFYTIPSAVRFDSSRRGFTLIELLVVVAVVGLLLAILLPAVQSARGAARRSSCINNLHKLGISLNAYESAHRVFPQGRNGREASIHVALLPHLDLVDVYNSLNMVTTAPWSMNSGPNMTAFGVQISVFLCPADVTSGPKEGRTNYPGCMGYGTGSGPISGVFSDSSPAGPPIYIGPASVIDGTSTTVAMSEWALGRDKVRDPIGSVFRTKPLLAPGEFEAFVAACQGIPTSTGEIALSGKSAEWPLGQYVSTLYNHDLMIDQHSCVNGQSVNEGAWTAGSHHLGGASVLFADAHVQFVRDTTSLQVWRAIGTRGGREIASDGSY